MNRLFLAALPLLTAASAAVLVGSHPAQQPPAPTAAASKVPVVVELFTSEGCSSCPAADATLRELETAQSVAGVEVIALGQHVDYWNRLGWSDPFSSPLFTQRQRDYAEHFKEGSYTPQAVINGQYELVGSQRQKIVAAIANAAKAPRAAVDIRRAGSGGNLVVSVAKLPAGTSQADVLLALTETGLSSQVGRGENSGRFLRHASVVRTLRTLGTVAANAPFTSSVPLNLDTQWAPAHLRAVVLVQERASRHIVGAASLPLGSSALTPQK